MPIVDGSQIKDLVALPNNWYPAKFDKYELAYGKDSGNPYDAVEFVVASEDSPDGEEHRLFYNMTVTDKSMWRWKRDAIALGADPAIFDGEFDTEDVLDGLEGNACRIQVTIQTKGDYAGRNQVKSIKAPNFEESGDAAADDEVDDN